MRAGRFDRRFERSSRRRPARRAPAASADRPGRAGEIAELAEAVAGEDAPGVPVDPAAIARAKGVTLSVGDYGRCFDALLECRCGRFHIYLDAGRVGSIDAPRGRFSLAHELGHFFLDEHREALRDGAAPSDRSWCVPGAERLVEREADTFAAALLMPSKPVLADAKGRPRGLAGVLAVAERFGVSLTAAAIRYAELEVCPCAVVKWARGEAAWRRVSSQGLFGRTGRGERTLAGPPPISPVTASALPADCATSLALAGRPPEGRWHETGTTSAAWFSGIRPGDRRDVPLLEQAVSLDSRGALTLLLSL